MKILVCIAHYGTSNREHLHRVLSEFDSYKKYEVTVTLFVTDPVDTAPYKNIKVMQNLFDRSIGTMLTREHKKVMAGLVNDYDLFIYDEDDILITEKNIDTFLYIQKAFNDTNYVCGFLRYELKPNDPYKFLVDCHPAHTIHRRTSNILYQKSLFIKGMEYFEPTNIHQGCYILTKDLLKRCIDSGNYISDAFYAGQRESDASGVYVFCGLTKVISKDSMKDLLVHHLSNKYVTTHPLYTKELVVDDEKLLKMSNLQTKTLAVILHHNTPKYTKDLYEMLAPEQKFGYDLIVLDNGSDPDKGSEYTTMRLDENVFFGGAMDVMFQYMCSEEGQQYDSLLFLNNDLIVGNNFVLSLRQVFKTNQFDIISPFIIQPEKIQNHWRQMQSWGTRMVREVKWADLQCPMISRRFIEHIRVTTKEGSECYLDPLLLRGWGIEIYFGIIAQQLGWKIGVCDYVPVVHLGSMTMKALDNVSLYCRLAEEGMNEFFKKMHLMKEYQEMREWGEKFGMI